jgi:hypothetical protein
VVLTARETAKSNASGDVGEGVEVGGDVGGGGMLGEVGRKLAKVLATEVSAQVLKLEGGSEDGEGAVSSRG